MISNLPAARRRVLIALVVTGTSLALPARAETSTSSEQIRGHPRCAAVARPAQTVSAGVSSPRRGPLPSIPASPCAPGPGGGGK